MNSEQSGVKICRHPECVDHATDTYVGGDGNELELCGEHYFKAVYPGAAPVVSTVTRRETDEASGFLGEIFR